ncbi:MAG: LacI family DNA-binding transcriptional regulator [Victivallales bacterium]|nr:LacI family DNA-binding transcriptional regulator [Victivallales bacterium]
MSAPSVKVVAKRCGVSPSTVCRALNGKGDVNPETRRACSGGLLRIGIR